MQTRVVSAGEEQKKGENRVAMSQHHKIEGREQAVPKNQEEGFLHNPQRGREGERGPHDADDSNQIEKHNK